MSDTESNSNSGSSSNAGKNKPANKPKRQMTNKVRQLFTEREKVRANLTAKLGKGARVANAAAFFKKYPTAENRSQHINTFVTSIRERNAKKVVNKPTKAKNTKAEVAAPAPAPTPAPKKTTTAKRGRKPLPTAYKKNKSLEKQAEKVIKKAEAIQKELDKANIKLKDVCDLCKDLRPNTPPKA